MQKTRNILKSIASFKDEQNVKDVISAPIICENAKEQQSNNSSAFQLLSSIDKYPFEQQNYDDSHDHSLHDSSVDSCVDMESQNVTKIMELKEELRSWATNFNITHRSIGALLKILTLYVSKKIPLDP